ncbi:MAG: RHS repeat-associated core domain-containing protein, partial [Myxococcota bacterium]
MVSSSVERYGDGLVQRVTRDLGVDEFDYSPAERWLESAELEGVFGRSWSAEYDASGNRSSITQGSASVSYESNALNQYASVDGVTFAYDKNGNLRDDGSLQYAYDAFNQLTEVFTDSGPVARYHYDAFGRLIARETDDFTVDYLYDDGQLVAVRDASTGEILRRYVYQPDAVDVPLALIVGGQTYYFELNSLGSVTALVDDNGALVERVEYDESGTPRVTSPSGSEWPASSLGNELYFQGRHYDAATGLYNNRARWYSPRLGRFLSSDPLGPVDGINTYAYALNDPVNFSDPSGEIATPIAFGIVLFLLFTQNDVDVNVPPAIAATAASAGISSGIGLLSSALTRGLPLTALGFRAAGAATGLAQGVGASLTA